MEDQALRGKLHTLQLMAPVPAANPRQTLCRRNKDLACLRMSDGVYGVWGVNREARSSPLDSVCIPY